MCHRFYVDEDTMKDIRRIVAKVDREISGIRTGDVHPTAPAPVITGRDPGLRAEVMAFGFSRPGKNLRMVNARAESAFTVPSWSESIMRRRCVIPAGHFYEWNSDKTMVTFREPGTGTMYFAGFYDIRENQEQFVILTTAANDSMRKVHDRMPLILPADRIEDWIFRDEETEHFLKMGSPELESWQEYEQLSLF